MFTPCTGGKDNRVKARQIHEEGEGGKQEVKKVLAEVLADNEVYAVKGFPKNILHVFPLTLLKGSSG